MKLVHIKLEGIEMIIIGEYEEYCPGDRITPPGGGTFDAHEVMVRQQDISDLISEKILDKINQLCYDRITDGTY